MQSLVADGGFCGKGVVGMTEVLLLEQFGTKQ